MKRILVLFGLIAVSSSAFCTELFYNWKPGGTYSFEATAVDNISMSMSGMSFGQGDMNMEYTTNTKFVLLIESVDAFGTADGAVYLQEFTVKNKAGKLMASLADIPQSAIFTDVQVDRKGNFTFTKEIYMLVTETSNILVSADVETKEDQNSIGGSATVQMGDIKVNAYAEFNPSTGTMKSGYSMKTISQTKSVSVKVEGDDAKLDVIPYSFLELMVLPDGDLNTGDEVNMTAVTQQVNLSVLSMADGLASIQTNLSEDKDASLTESSIDMKSPTNGMEMNMDMDEDDFDMDIDTEELDMDMDTDFDDMDDMDLDMDDMGMDLDMMGMDPFGNGLSASSMMPTMTGTINSTFDYIKGMFGTVNGFVTTNMDMMGMKLNTKTTISMRLLK